PDRDIGEARRDRAGLDAHLLPGAIELLGDDRADPGEGALPHLRPATAHGDRAVGRDVHPLVQVDSGGVSASGDTAPRAADAPGAIGDDEAGGAAGDEEAAAGEAAAPGHHFASAARRIARRTRP